MPCRICGDPATIEAHVIPRALYRRLAGNKQHAMEGSLFRTGTRYQAKGVFDADLLCALHERMLATADDYGMRFLHHFETAGRVGIRGNVWLVPNPKLTFSSASLLRAYGGAGSPRSVAKLRNSILAPLSQNCWRCCSKAAPAFSRR